MSATRPPLVIVSGAPGSGKTRLAAALAEALELPLIARDELKERLADVLLPPDADPDIGAGPVDSSSLGRAAYAVLYAMTDRLIDAGTGAIVESNFRRGMAEAELAPRVARTTAVLAHCQAPDELVLERCMARAGSADRHRVHRDLGRLDLLRDDLANDRFEPLELGIETIRIDTSSGYAPPLADVVERITRAIGRD